MRKSRPGSRRQRGHVALFGRGVAGQPLVAVARRRTRLAVVFGALGDAVGKNADAIERAAQPLGAVRVARAPDPCGVHACRVARAIGPAVARAALRPNLATGPGLVAAHRSFAHAVGAQNADAARRAHGARVAHTAADDRGTRRGGGRAAVVAAGGTNSDAQASAGEWTRAYEPSEGESCGSHEG